jgi:hypothetical protein
MLDRFDGGRRLVEIGDLVEIVTGHAPSRAPR